MIDGSSNPWLATPMYLPYRDPTLKEVVSLFRDVWILLQSFLDVLTPHGLLYGEHLVFIVLLRFLQGLQGRIPYVTNTAAVVYPNFKKFSFSKMNETDFNAGL